MEIEAIEYTSHFRRSYRKLDPAIQKKTEAHAVIFRRNPFDPRLKTHKLHGKLKEFHSFSVDGRMRIVFRFVGRRKAVFLDVGDHGIYQ